MALYFGDLETVSRYSRKRWPNSEEVERPGGAGSCRADAAGQDLLDALDVVNGMEAVQLLPCLRR